MRGFGDLEAVVMDQLWSAGKPTPVRTVFESIASARPIAYNTVLTVMENLHRKGWLDREMAGRAHLYAPVRSREAYSAELMSEALGASHDPGATLVAFCEQLSPEEARRLAAALAGAGGLQPSGDDPASKS